MDRRTFTALMAAGALCLGSRKAFPSPSSSEIYGSGAAASRAAPHVTDGRFPVSTEDYNKVETEYLPLLVTYLSGELPGTIIIDTDSRFLYLVLGPSLAKRYGIGVGREGFGWSGTATVKRKTVWPTWYPPKEMRARDREAARWRKGMPGGPRNPLGARALYLFQGEADTLFRIHGTRDPKSIGRAVSSGCIRMLNADVVELFDNVPHGTKVIVLPSSRPIARVTVKSDRMSRKAARMAQAKKQRRRKMRTALFRRRRQYRSILGLFGLQGDW